MLENILRTSVYLFNCYERLFCNQVKHDGKGVRGIAKGQNEGRQLAALKELGISERDIYTEKRSGKNFKRPEYQTLKRALRKGDILYVHSLDRLGRGQGTKKGDVNIASLSRQEKVIIYNVR